MRTKLISISILALLLFGLLACFTASALPPDPLVVATDPVDGEMGYPVSPAMTYLTADFFQKSGHPMMVRCGTNASGVFVWSNWVGPVTNDTINYPFYANLTEHTYYWTVLANDSYGNSSNTTFSFTTEGADPNTTITYPVDASTISTFTHISGTSDNSSTVLVVILFDFTNLSYWNWGAGNWSLGDLNSSFTTPIGVTSWTVTADMPTLAEGHSYGVAVYGNNSYNTDFDSVGFTYRTTPSSQLGFMGSAAKLLLGVVLLVIAGGIIYYVISVFFTDKKKRNFKDMIQAMLTALIVSIVLIVAAAAVIAF